jgi:flagellar biosynthesis/type III secretory pathway protein FliH
MLKTEKPYSVIEKYPGIYEVAGLPFPARIMASNRLEKGNELWLSLLRKNVPKEEIAQLAARDTQVSQQIETSAFWYIIRDIVTPNIERSGDSVRNLETVLEETGLIAKWKSEGLAEGLAEGEARGLAEGEARGLARGEARGKSNTLSVVKGLLNNKSIEQLSAETNISTEEIEAIRLELLPV